MKRPAGLLVLAVLVLMLVWRGAAPASGQADGIVVTRADLVVHLAPARSQQLIDLTAAVPPRLLISYANTLRHITIPPIPSALQHALGEIADRIMLQDAKHNRNINLVYPIAFFNDTTAPVTGNVSVEMAGNQQVIIRWQTDELADSRIDFWPQGSSCLRSSYDGEYVINHELVLANLQPSVLYHYIIVSADRSGNRSSSGPHSFVSPGSAPGASALVHCVHLPMFLR